MACFSAGILIYAGLMALTKYYKILPYRSRVSVKPRDEKRYMTQLSKVMALVVLSPALSALTVIWSSLRSVVILCIARLKTIRADTANTSCKSESKEAKKIAMKRGSYHGNKNQTCRSRLLEL